MANSTPATIPIKTKADSNVDVDDPLLTPHRIQSSAVENKINKLVVNEIHREFDRVEEATDEEGE
jgi:hypothetical protein